MNPSFGFLFLLPSFLFLIIPFPSFFLLLPPSPSFFLRLPQVPQFLLDELLDNDDCAGGEIVVTQPRRLAAIAVAMRVADERGERVGDSVGYAVRLENSRATAPCKITFCTTGILLRRMSGDGGVDGVVHVVIDEVHERDLNTDFLLVREPHHITPDVHPMYTPFIHPLYTLYRRTYTSYTRYTPHIHLTRLQTPSIHHSAYIHHCIHPLHDKPI